MSCGYAGCRLTMGGERGFLFSLSPTVLFVFREWVLATGLGGCHRAAALGHGSTGLRGLSYVVDAWRRNGPSFRFTGVRFSVAPSYYIGASVCKMTGLVAVGAHTGAVVALFVAVIEPEVRVGLVVADNTRSPGDIALLDVDA